MAAEYIYRVAAWWTSGRTGLAKCESAPNTIHFSEAPEFGGLEGRWTPEQLLLCSLAGCFHDYLSGGRAQREVRVHRPGSGSGRHRPPQQDGKQFLRDQHSSEINGALGRGIRSRARTSSSNQGCVPDLARHHRSANLGTEGRSHQDACGRLGGGTGRDAWGVKPGVRKSSAGGGGYDVFLPVGTPD